MKSNVVSFTKPLVTVQTLRLKGMKKNALNVRDGVDPLLNVENKGPSTE